MTPGSIRISITDAMSRDEIAGHGLGDVAGRVLAGHLPRYLGNGVIDLGGNDENDVLTLSTSLEIERRSRRCSSAFRVPAAARAA